MKLAGKKGEPCCAFCRRGPSQVKIIEAASPPAPKPGVAICVDCVRSCATMLGSEAERAAR